MKKTIPISLMNVSALVIICLFIAQSAFAGKYRKYPFKTGIVEYTLDGSTKGTQVIFWDDYGFREATVEKSVTKVMGQTTENNKTTLINGSVIYTWSDTDPKVYKTDNFMIAEWEKKNYSDDDVEKFAVETMKQLGFEKIGTETFLGRTCDVYKGMGKIWAWKGLALKSEVNVLGVKTNITATDVKTNVPVPGSVFELPKGKEVVDSNVEYKKAADASGEEVPVTPDDVKNMLKGLFGGE